MINQVIIEGTIQPGWQDKPAVVIRKNQDGSNVVEFQIISKHEPENKFSSGIVRVKRWANDHEIGMFEMIGAGDMVTVQGKISTGNYPQGDKKVFYLYVNADEVSPMIPAEEIQPEPEEKGDMVKESDFNLKEDEAEAYSNDEQIPF